MHTMSLAKKLLIKSGYRVIVVNAPADFELTTEEAAGEIIHEKQLNGAFDFLLLFAQNQAELARFVPEVLPHLKEAAIFWVAYPKKSAKLKSDITRDSGWDVLKQQGYQGVSLISIDDTWSAFRVRHEKYIKKLN
jgi:predicted CoA-binding protein